jgi:hypothetical protein
MASSGLCKRYDWTQCEPLLLARQLASRAAEISLKALSQIEKHVIEPGLRDFGHHIQKADTDVRYLDAKKNLSACISR